MDLIEHIGLDENIDMIISKILLILEMEQTDCMLKN